MRNNFLGRLQIALGGVDWPGFEKCKAKTGRAEIRFLKMKKIKITTQDGIQAFGRRFCEWIRNGINVIEF